MKVVRYGIDILPFSQVIEMPAGAKILDVQTVRDVHGFWALVDETAKLEKRTFLTFHDEDTIKDSSMDYLGSFNYANGLESVHVFEKK